MNWPLFLSTFTLIFIAELPDKTALTTILMAAESEPLAVFLGVSGAFVVQSGVAVSFGRLFTLIGEQWVHLLIGLLFLAFAAQIWRKGRESADAEKTEQLAAAPAFWRTVLKAFLVTFVAEWGDLTQLATASLAANYPKFLGTIFASSVCALCSATALCVLVGRQARKTLPTQKLQKASAVLFAGLGFYFLFTWVAFVR